MFDIEQLKKNQRDHIASHKEDMEHWSCDLHKDSLTNIGDAQIEEIFSELNKRETEEVKFSSMKGPIDFVGPEEARVLVVSRGSKSRADWFSPNFMEDYYDGIVYDVDHTLGVLRKHGKGRKFVFYLAMWIPVYAAFAPKEKFRGGILLHYGRKALWENEDAI